MHLKEYIQATEITALFSFCAYLFYPILGPYAKTLGLTEFQIGLMFAIFPLTLILSSSISGSLSDSIGRKKVIMYGIIVELVAIICYLLGTPFLMLIARFLEALAFASVIFVGLARIQDSLDEKTRGKYSGIALTLFQIGKIIAPVLGGLIADYWFIKGPFLFSAFGLLIMLWLVALHEKMSFGHHFTRSEFNMFRNVKAFFSYRGLRGLGLLGIVMHASIPLTLVFIPIYITEGFGLSYQYIGYALLAMEFFMLFQWAVGKLADRFDKAKITLAGCLVFGVGMLILSLAPGYGHFIAVMLFIGIGASFWNVGCWSYMSEIGTRIRREGLVVGTYFSVAKVGSFLSFIFGGMVVHYMGVKYLMVIVGVLILVGTFTASFFMLTQPHKKRRSR